MLFRNNVLVMHVKLDVETIYDCFRRFSYDSNFNYQCGDMYELSVRSLGEVCSAQPKLSRLCASFISIK